MPQTAQVTEQQLVANLQPLRGFVLAAAVLHLFESGLYDALHAQQEVELSALAETLGHHPERLHALLTFLANEQIVELDGDVVALDVRAGDLAAVRPWYEMIIGGYGETFLQIGDRLRVGSPSATRDGSLVASGSCGISEHDSLPIVRRLLADSDRSYSRLLDLGCGSGIYLTELARWYPELEAVGIEPSPEAVAAARAWVERAGLQDRIAIELADAVPFIESGVVEPDLVLLCFVVHEVLGQRGEAGVRTLLSALFGANPGADLVIVDVDQRFHDPDAMRHPLATAYYNGYFLLHPFTQQRLERVGWWEELFRSCGLRVVKRLTTDPRLDSTGFEIGWLLRADG